MFPTQRCRTIRGLQSLCNQSIHFLSAIFLMQKIKDLIQWRLNAWFLIKRVINPWLESLHNPGVWCRVEEVNNILGQLVKTRHS